MLVAIGDIHGESWKLHRLLQKLDELPLSDDDRLVLLGDYVDRGPEVPLTLDMLIDLKERRPNTIFLRGNHDQTLLDVRELYHPDPERPLSYTREDVGWWFSYGGGATIAAYSKYGPGEWVDNVPEAHWEFLKSTEIEYREGGYIFVHAGLLPPRYRWYERQDARLWVRDWFIESNHNFGGVVVFGHTITPDFKPRVEPNKIGIDTGVARGGPLTAALLEPFHPERVRFVQT